LNRQDSTVNVQVKYKDVQKTFSGRAEDVWLSVSRFFSEFIPTFDVARKLILRIDLQELVKSSQGIIAFSQEGPNVLVPRNKLTDNETLAVWLLANYIGTNLGLLSVDAVSKEELQTKLGKNAKITGTRLGEFVKNETAAKTADEKYRITTFGIVQMQRDMLPKIRAKLTG
jgi:hypothetical protein